MRFFVQSDVMSAAHAYLYTLRKIHFPCCIFAERVWENSLGCACVIYVISKRRQFRRQSTRIFLNGSISSIQGAQSGGCFGIIFLNICMSNREIPAARIRHILLHKYKVKRTVLLKNKVFYHKEKDCCLQTIFSQSAYILQQETATSSVSPQFLSLYEKCFQVHYKRKENKRNM